MLNKVTVFSPTPAVPPLVFDLKDIPETALFELHNIDGLNPVKAAITTSPYSTGVGESYGGSSIGKRNLVFTIGLNPDWNEFTMTALRRKLDAYFMPKMNVTIFFEGDEQAPVVISGYVESNEPNIFTKDPEHQVSIICPEPDFVAVDPIVIGPLTANWYETPIDYKGTVETGIHVEFVGQPEMGSNNGDQFTLLLAVGDPVFEDDGVTIKAPFFRVTAFAGSFSEPADHLVNLSNKLVVSSVPRDRYIQTVGIPGGEIRNVLKYLENYAPSVWPGPAVWPMLKPGMNHFQPQTNAGYIDWTLTYFERFGSL